MIMTSCTRLKRKLFSFGFMVHNQEHPHILHQEISMKEFGVCAAINVRIHPSRDSMLVFPFSRTSLFHDDHRAWTSYVPSR